MHRLFILLFVCTYLFAQNDTVMVDLRVFDKTILLDCRYGTTNNFTGKRIYSTQNVYLRRPVAKALSDLNSYMIKKYKLRLKIFDGYRPFSIQKKLWKLQPNYFMNPKNGSRHSRGATVDLSICDMKGNNIEMGTDFDNFTEKANLFNNDVDEKAKKNRLFLYNLMKKYGFIGLISEWWHYDFKNWKKYNILDFKN